MSSSLPQKIRLLLAQLAETRDEIRPLVALAAMRDIAPGRIEQAAASAMLHSFYRELERVFELVADEIDGDVPIGDLWHSKLLARMTEQMNRRPAVISTELADALKEYLAFRHVFRNASIMECNGKNLCRC